MALVWQSRVAIGVVPGRRKAASRLVAGHRAQAGKPAALSGTLGASVLCQRAAAAAATGTCGIHSSHLPVASSHPSLAGVRGT